MHYPENLSGFPSHSHALKWRSTYKFYPQMVLYCCGWERAFWLTQRFCFNEPNKVHPGCRLCIMWRITFGLIHNWRESYIKTDLTRSICGGTTGAKYWPDSAKRGKGKGEPCTLERHYIRNQWKSNLMTDIQVLQAKPIWRTEVASSKIWTTMSSSEVH